MESKGGVDAYSFVFNGQSGALDHALATASLVAQVALAVTEIRIAVAFAGRPFGFEMVNEFFGETQVTASSVTIRGVGAIQPAPISLPAITSLTNSDGDLIADLERYEGMLIRLPQSLTVSALFDLERYGEVRLVQGGRPFQFTNQNAPDVAGYTAHREALAARTLVLDDGRRESNVTPIQYLTAGASPGYSIRTGDQVIGLTGERACCATIGRYAPLNTASAYCRRPRRL